MHKRMSPHGDYDHMGNAKFLVDNIKVRNVLFNCGEFNEIEEVGNHSLMLLILSIAL